MAWSHKSGHAPPNKGSMESMAVLMQQQQEQFIFCALDKEIRRQWQRRAVQLLHEAGLGRPGGHQRIGDNLAILEISIPLIV